MLRKYFISNITIMVLLNLLVKPLWIFLIDRKVQIIVGHEEYGLYYALLGLSIMFNILLDVGITNLNNKRLAEERTLIVSKLPNMILAKALLSLLYFLVVFIAAYFSGYGERALFLLFLLAIMQMLNSFLLFLRSNVSANHDFRMDSFLSVTDKVLIILTCGYLFIDVQFREAFRIEWFIYIQILAYLVTILIALVYIIKRYTHIRFSHYSRSEMIDLFRNSLPYGVLIFLMAVYMRSDAWLLERLAGATENSIYCEAYRILDAANMIAFLFAGILLPIFSRMLTQKLPVESLVVTSTNIMIPPALALVAFCTLYCGDIMTGLYPDADAYLILIFILVMLSFPAYCLLYVYFTLLTANGNIRLLIRLALSGSVISIGSNLLLIHYYQAVGAALTGLAVPWILSLASVFFCIYKFKLRVNVIRVLKFVCVLLVMLSLNYFLVFMQIPVLYAVLPNALVFLICVYMIRLWNIENILGFIRQHKNFH